MLTLCPRGRYGRWWRPQLLQRSHILRESADSWRLSKSFAAARCLEATQGESSLLELHAGGKPR
jgi:hypothetical protein